MLKQVQNLIESIFTYIYELHNIYEFFCFVHLVWLQTKGKNSE